MIVDVQTVVNPCSTWIALIISGSLHAAQPRRQPVIDKLFERPLTMIVLIVKLGRRMRPLAEIKIAVDLVRDQPNPRAFECLGDLLQIFRRSISFRSDSRAR